MNKEDWEKLDVQTFNLSPDLFVPISAKDIPTIEKYVGKVTKIIYGRKRPINGFVVEAERPKPNPLIPLWCLKKADLYYSRLHPVKQFWVHVDYSGYRRAWKRLGFSNLTSDIFLIIFLIELLFVVIVITVPFFVYVRFLGKQIQIVVFVKGSKVCKSSV